MLRLYPLLDARRRGSGVNIVRDGVFWVAQKGEWRFYFNSAYKAGRYLFPEGETDIFHVLLKKYSSRDGRVAVRQGDIVVDIGANVGEFVSACAKRARRVVAIDPDPSAFACLTRNCASISNVTCERTALGEKPGVTKFYLSPDGNDSSIIKPETYREAIEVRVLPLADVLLSHGIERVDFLKVEAEGYEPEVLKGALPVLPTIGKVAVDASPERRGESTAPECIELLERAGFRVFQEGWMVFGARD
jgi:FkbM family methyltransferase